MEQSTAKDLRLFFGNPLPVEWQKFLIRCMEINTSPSGKWIAEENLHITNLFIGKFPQELLPELAMRIESGLQSFSAAPLQFEGIKYAPPNGRARMIWAEFKQSEAFTALAHGLWQIVDGIANEHDLRIKKSLHNKVLPHVTLTRFAPEKAENLSTLSEPDDVPKELIVKEVNLYKSSLSPKGAKYEVLKQFLLT